MAESKLPYLFLAYYICYLISTFIVGIILLVIGSINVNSCPIEPMIPIWLIAYGVEKIIFLAAFVPTFVAFVHFELETGKKNFFRVAILFAIIMVIFLGFVLAWTICGSIWVYSKYERIIADSSESLCSKTCYFLAFTFLTINWIMTPVNITVFALGAKQTKHFKSKVLPQVQSD